MPFAGRALCLTRLLGKGEPSCFLLLPLHCGFPSRERQVCPQAVVADARRSRTTHLARLVATLEDTPVLLVLVMTHM